VDAHRDRKHFIVHVDEKLTAFVELQRRIHEFDEIRSGQHGFVEMHSQEWEHRRGAKRSARRQSNRTLRRAAQPSS